MLQTANTDLFKTHQSLKLTIYNSERQHLPFALQIKPVTVSLNYNCRVFIFSTFGTDGLRVCRKVHPTRRCRPYTPAVNRFGAVQVQRRERERGEGGEGGGKRERARETGGGRGESRFIQSRGCLCSRRLTIAQVHTTQA